jgi:ABC-type multidrug transport system fused ATPase/permease subunit
VPAIEPCSIRWTGHRGVSARPFACYSPSLMRGYGIPHEHHTRAAAAATPVRLRTLWPQVQALVRPRRGLLAAGCGLMVINRLAGLVLPASTKFLIDDVIGKHRADILVPLALAVLLATALQGGTSYALVQLLSKAAQRLIADLRRQVQAHIAALPIAYYDANKSGALVARIMSDVEGVRNLLGTGMVEFLGGLLTAVVAVGAMLRISPPLAVFALALVLVFGLVLRKSLRSVRPIFRARGKINAEVTGRLTESLAGVRVVKGYRAEAREAAVFGQGVQRLLDNVLRSLGLIAGMSLSATLFVGVLGAGVMYLGVRQIFAGSLTLGEFVTFTAFLAFLVAPVTQVVGIGTQLSEALAGLERTQEVLRERPEDLDPRRRVTLPPLQGDVVFDRVRFAYPASPEVLQDLSFHAAPGTVTAMVGPSGGGKSTIIGLVAGFYAPTGGTVSVDGVDLTTVRLDSYRTQLGVVLQESFLFDGTIRENVAFSRPGASDAAVLAACRIARVDEFAETLPQQYDTLVGERGVKLSGGQRQRVSIARAILADPRILILDEATSSLDSESEALIQEGLTSLMRGRTTLVIAHRLSTIRQSDQILVIEAGRIVEQGRHEALLGARGRYFALYTRQHGVETNLFLPGGSDENGGDGASLTEDESSSVETDDPSPSRD